MDEWADDIWQAIADNAPAHADNLRAMALMPGERCPAPCGICDMPIYDRPSSALICGECAAEETE